MSLVLEALRKQQADIDPSAAVTLGLMVAQRRRQRTWIALLTVALLLNAAVFAWLFRDRLSGDAGVAAPVAEPLGVPAAPPAEIPAAAGTPVPAPASGAAVPALPIPTTPTAGFDPSNPAATPQHPGTYPAAAPPPRVLERVTLDALPSSSRSRFPGIVISTHVYAEEPSMRAIVVNGGPLQEGDAVGGLTIREITESGVLLEFEDYLVEVPVFTDW